MRFFHKYIEYFYAIPFCLSILFFILAKNLKNDVFVYIFCVFCGLAILVFSYNCLRKIFDIYKTFIYVPLKEKILIKMRMQEDEFFKEEYMQEKKYKRGLYRATLIKNIFYLLFAFFVVLFVLRILF